MCDDAGIIIYYLFINVNEKDKKIFNKLTKNFHYSWLTGGLFVADSDQPIISLILGVFLSSITSFRQLWSSKTLCFCTTVDHVFDIKGFSCFTTTV